MAGSEYAYHDSNQLTSSSIEEPLCNYLGAFDGTKKSFRDILPYFDDLFSDTLIHMLDGHPMDKSAFRCINEQLLEQRMVATLEDIYFADDSHVEYTVHWSNGCASVVSHAVALVVDSKIVLVKPCEETKSVFANMIDNCRSGRINPLQNQFKNFRGWARRS